MHAIFNFMQELFTRENVTFAIAVFGAVGTARSIFQSRKKVEFIPLGYTLNEDHDLIVHFEIINHSTTAISIVNISYIYDGEHYSCSKERAIAESIYHERRHVPALKDFYTQPFPLQLVGLGGRWVYIQIELPPKIHPDFSKPQSFQVSANRGKATEMKLLLTDSDSSSLHKSRIPTLIRSFFRK